MKINESIIKEILADSIQVKETSILSNMSQIAKAAEIVATSIATGHKILLFGNGGSAADAQHIAAEFVNRFQIERPPLPAIALTTDTSIITSIGNDYSFEQIFAKQIRAIGKSGDVAIGISTSGNSPNVIQAIKIAVSKNIFTIGLTGKDGGKMKDAVDLLIPVHSNVTARIQETHITIGHILCDLVDKILFS